MNSGAARYSAVAIVLHWAIAAAIVLMIPLGFWMHWSSEHGDASEAVFRAFQLHKSIGLAVLALSVVRLGWRLANPPPPPPAHMPGWERFIAKATHWAFYALMIGLPVSGWLYVSAGWSIHEDAPLPVATRFFGLFEVPALFGLSTAGVETRADVAEAAFGAHRLMAFAMLGLAPLHVLAALKHHVFDRDETLVRMVPGLRAPFEAPPRKREPVRLAILGGGLALTAVALAAALFALAGAGHSTAPAQDTAAPFSAPLELPGPATAWEVDAAASAIGFSFGYAREGGDLRFDGRFESWRAAIRFDADDLESSAVLVEIDAASARDGAPLHDSTLPSEPWFNAAAYPVATFRSNDIRRTDEGYVARGDLIIKGRNRTLDLPFTLSIEGDQAVMRANTQIDRRDFDIGEDSEADAVVSREIGLSISVVARRAP